MTGGPHPGFEILGFNLYSGNGTPKNIELVNVGLGKYDEASNNNVPVDLFVGRRLSWESWHKLTLNADLVNNTYLSLTVDGVTQDLTGTPLPRSFVEGEGWQRGGLIQHVLAQVVPNDWTPTEQTASDIYWDNLAITATLRPGR